MRFSSLLVILFGTFNLAAAPAPSTQPISSTPPVRPLVEIASVDQLAKQPLITLASGETVRLGIGPMLNDLGPWRIVYCQVEDYAPPSHLPVSEPDGQPLGPLFAQCVWKDAKNFKQVDKNRVKRQLQRIATPGSPTIYQTLLAMDRPGPALVRLLQSDGAEIAELPIDIPASAPEYWRAFERDNFGPDRAPGQPYLIVDENNTPVAPELPMLVSEWALQTASARTPLAGAPPQAVSPQAAPTLKVSLQDNVFIVDGGDYSLCDDDCLLARWWINGNPQPADRHAPQQLQAEQQGRAVDAEPILKIGFGLPSDLSHCVAGDQIGLQVMYSARGWTPLSDIRILAQAMVGGQLSQSMPDLLLSNRLDFTLTAEQLKLIAASDQPAK